MIPTAIPTTVPTTATPKAPLMGSTMVQLRTTADFRDGHLVATGAAHTKVLLPTDHIHKKFAVQEKNIRGFALYVSDKDHDSFSTCNDECLFN